MKHFPIGMEMFNAGNDQQWKIITDTIDNSDYYVLILGQRYGSILENGDDKGISYTEREYKYAVSKSIPVIAFIKADDASLTVKDVEKSSKNKKRLNQLKDDVKSKHMVEWFETSDELAQKVTNALYQSFVQDERPGWIRSNSGNAEKIASELAESSKKIRELEEENRELRKQVSDRKPILSINLGIDVADDEGDEDKKHSDLFKTSPLVKENGTGFDIQIKKINPLDYSDRYAPLAYDDHAKKLGVSRDEIANYNEQLPNAKKIKEINDYATAHKMFINNGMAFCVDINNNGTAKATDVRVHIKFPNEFSLYDLDKAEGFDKLQLPKLPENPIKKAEEMKRQGQMGLMDALYKWDVLPYQYENFSHNIPDVLPDLMRYSGRAIHENTDVKDHEVLIEKDQILHPNSDRFSRFYMIPRAAGEYQLQCEIMCSEYKEPIYQEITVNVIEAGEI